MYRRKTHVQSTSDFADSTFYFNYLLRHHPDLILCRKLPGIAIGRLCEKDDGKW